MISPADSGATPLSVLDSPFAFLKLVIALYSPQIQKVLQSFSDSFQKCYFFMNGRCWLDLLL